MQKLILSLFFFAAGTAVSFLSKVIDRQVWFWEQVFTRYHSSQVVVHDESPSLNHRRDSSLKRLEPQKVVTVCKNI